MVTATSGLIVIVTIESLVVVAAELSELVDPAVKVVALADPEVVEDPVIVKPGPGSGVMASCP